MKKEKFKFKGIKIKRFDNFIMLFVPKEVHKDRIYFTHRSWLMSLLFGKKDIMYANIFYKNYNKEVNKNGKV